MKRSHALLFLTVLFLAWVSCTSVRKVSVDPTVRDPAVSGAKATGRRMVGYTTTDAVYRPFKGFYRFVDPDSIAFFRSWNTMRELSMPEITLPRSEVMSVSEARVNGVAVLGLVVVTVALVAVIVSVGQSSPPPPPPAQTSCPFVYSWNGDQFVLDAEPYGGATMRALERTDVTELENLVDSKGRYRVLLTNEMRETQHTNRIDLLVVDHAPGRLVAVDPEGEARAFRDVAPLVAARAASGHDLLPWLREKDQVIWHPDLEAASSHLPMADTRDHITLTFARPAGASRAYLLADAATAPWGAEMIRTMLELRGFTVGLFYAAINSVPASRARLEEWNEREDLFYLPVEVEEDGGWVKQGRLIGGGPVAAETRAVPLDLRRVTGDQVRVRLHPPVGYWMFNAFRLAHGEEPVQAQVVAPVLAQDQAGGNVLSRITRDDGDYLDFVSNDDHAVVEFVAPPRTKRMDRTVFSRTRGWYEIRLDASGMPDFAALDRIANEPGYPVQRAMEDYRVFREPGVRAGEPRQSMRQAERN